MGLLKKLTSRVLGIKSEPETSQQKKQALLRRCYFEVMEQRRVLSADPVIAAVTYFEGDAGQDTTPDHFEVTFEGGSATTHLTQFTINGDQDASGDLTNGDMFFDVNSQMPGAGGYQPFLFDAAHSTGITASDVSGFSVSSDGLTLTVQLDNFDAGDIFAFTIDVDEVERFRADMIASGVEFEGTLFNASFVDEHYTFEDKLVSLNVTLQDNYVQLQQEGIFFDEYDELFGQGELLAGQSIDLSLDNASGHSDRTAGALDAYDLTPKPVSISGTVYHDENLNCEQDSNDFGIAGVQIQLQRWNDASGFYDDVASTTTDADGNYEFGEDLGLMPGTFRLVEVQPSGYLDVGVGVGSEGGIVADGLGGDQNLISNIEIPLGGTAATDYDFKEVKPVSLSGNVWHDQNDDGVFDPGEQGIANVLIQVTRLGAKPNVGNDPFAGTDPIMVRTDANGHYQVDGMPPGLYEVVEINNYPTGEVNPLAGYFDGKDSMGLVDGAVMGAQFNDRMTLIELCAGDEGTQYNFGELQVAKIGGFVSVTTPEGDCLDPTDPAHVGIAGVTIEIFDTSGNLVASTMTDVNGHYEFDNLAPGTYTIVETQPMEYLDGVDHVGKVDGTMEGAQLENDRFSNIVLSSGDVGSNYNFCEHVPAELSGIVWHDLNNNGSIDSGEEGIRNVVIELFDKSGNKIAETTTDVGGEYHFNNLYAGTYVVRETQPGEFVDGKDSLGVVNRLTAGMVEGNDAFCVTLAGGDVGAKFNFGELKLSEISGTVHVDVNGDCVFEASEGDRPLANVAMELLDSNGQVVATTTTDADGNYEFTGLLPGTYSIRELQPEQLFSGGESAGDGGGTTLENLIEGIVVQSGQMLTHYDFCEVEAAEINGRVWEDGPAIETEDGMPTPGYRSQRDGVFQPGVDTPLAGVRMQLYFYVDLANGSLVPRPVTLGEVQSEFYGHMGTNDPAAAVWVETAVNGEYSFKGLPAGNYIVLETQPSGLVDSNDSPGTTTGFSYNSTTAANAAPQSVLLSFSTAQIMDAIVNIRVNGGDVSEANNFSEVSFVADPPPPVLPPVVPPTQSTPGNTPPPLPGITTYPGLYGAQAAVVSQYGGPITGTSFGGQVAPVSYTWHLSVVNAGLPRGTEDGFADASIWQRAAYISNADWTRFDMDDAVWTFTQSQGPNHDMVRTSSDLQFGMIGGIPLAGDFDGDGTDEVAVFKDGYWMIDLNRNGMWDEGDLLVRLGDVGDRPVVGDWDGDGKDDIGIFGPIWEGDREAIEQEPGLPNPDNAPYTRPKNVPPSGHEAIHGARVMKLTSYGQQRTDVVDHVFGINNGADVPVTGDWNGNGIRSIGTFVNGVWKLDVNGDGRFDEDDETARFGRAGDIPLVGDFDGDGLDEIAVYRGGTWIIDSNGNRELDATDKTFELGGSLDKPVVGDWDGDGVDEAGLYTEQKDGPLFD